MKSHEGHAVPGTCRPRLDDGVLVYELSGELDLSAPQALAFDAPLDDIHAVVVDLERVTFFNSTALNALIRLRNRALHSGVSVHLAGPPSMVARVLEITGVDTVFAMHVNYEAALKALTQRARTAAGPVRAPDGASG